MFKVNNRDTRIKTLLSVMHERSQPVFTCSKLTIESLEQSVKCVQS